MDQKHNKTSSKVNKTQTGFTAGGNACAMCGRDDMSDQLKQCAQCGTVAYCGKECQRAAWPEHKEFCRQTCADFHRTDQKAKFRILFSRSFGGAVSLLMKVGAEHLGRGLIHAKLSHKLAEYCDKRRTVNKRTIELSYIPEGEKLLQLERTSLGASQAANWLTSAMECNDRIASEMVSHLGETADRFCIVALEQPGVKFLHTHIFLSYLNNQHPAHSAFHQLRRDPASTFTLDWDCDPTVSNTNNPDYPLQWLFYNSIGANFFRQCSMLWQEKRRTGDPSPWPGGVLTPPFAQQVNLTSNVPYHGV